MMFWPLVAFGIAMVVRYYLRDEPGGAAPRPRMLLAGALPAECLGARPRRIENAEPGELVAVYGTVVSEPTLTSLARRRASAYRAGGEPLHVRIAGGGNHAALVSTRDADRATFGGAL